jgi:hypothetical protein
MALLQKPSYISNSEMIQRKSIYFILKKIVSALAAAGIFFTTIELCARIDDVLRYGAPFTGKYDASILRETDREGIRHNVPGAAFEKWKINNNGFRGKDIAIEKPNGIKRIICMGTSETFGLYEEENYEWPAQLAKLLEEDGHFEVINASVVGMGLEHYRAYIERYVLKFRPDFMILVINPYFYFGSAYREGQNPNRAVGLNQELGQPIKNKNYDFQFRVITKIKNSIKRILPGQILRNYQIYNMEKEVQISRNKLKISTLVDDVDEKILLEFWRNTEKIVDFIESNGIKVLLCSYPALINESNKNLYPEIFFDGMRFNPELSLKGMICVLGRFNSAIQALSESRNIYFVDNYKKLPQAIENFGDNVHYTNLGAEIIAQNFVNLLRRVY